MPIQTYSDQTTSPQGLSSNAQPMESLKERIAIFSQQGEKLVLPPPTTITVNETVDEDDEEVRILLSITIVVI